MVFIIEALLWLPTDGAHLVVEHYNDVRRTLTRSPPDRYSLLFAVGSPDGMSDENGSCTPGDYGGVIGTMLRTNQVRIASWFLISIVPRSCSI